MNIKKAIKVMGVLVLLVIFVCVVRGYSFSLVTNKASCTVQRFIVSLIDDSNLSVSNGKNDLECLEESKK